MKNPFWLLVAGVACLLIMPACGQGEPAGLDEKEDSAVRGIDDPTDISLLEAGLSTSSTYIGIPIRGGWGGSPVNLWCVSGYVVVGIYGKAGSFLDRLGLVCAQLKADGSLGGQYATSSVGGTGGFDFQVMCPPGQAAVGVRGRSGSFVDQLGLLCSSVNNWVNDGSVQSTSALAGGSGGTSFYDPCPSDYVLAGLNLRSAQFVDQEQGICNYLTP